MKILHIINNLQGGGAEKMLSELLPIQNLKDESSILLLNNNNAKFYGKLQKHTEISVLQEWGILKILGIRRFVKLNKFDVLHVHLFPSLYYTVIATIGIDIPLVFTEHNTTNNRRKYRIFRYIERFIYNQYKTVICISKQVKENLVEHLNCKALKTGFKCISNGILLPSTNEVAPKTFESKDKTNLVMVGRFETQKDHTTLIEAMKLLDSNVHLYLVGTGSLIKDYKKLVSQENMSSRVHFLGFRNDVYDVLSKMDIAVLSSNWEGFGLAAVESMALGIPTVGSNVPGLSEVLKDGGLLFEKGDKFDLAKKINLLISSPKLYRKTSEQGVNKSKKYSIRKMSKKYFEVYREAISE